MWLSNGTRGDIAFAIGAVSRILHKRPKYEVFLAENILKYVNKTKLYVLEYLPGEQRKRGAPSTFQNREIGGSLRYIHRCVVCAAHRGVQGIAVEHCGNLLAWVSTRQVFVTQSTAESELLAFNEAYQVGESIAALLSVFGLEVERLYARRRVRV